SAVGARVFWHVVDASQSLAQALSVLKKGRPVIFDFPNSSGAFRILSAAMRSQNVITLFLTSSSIHRVLGLTNRSIIIEGHVSPILYLWPESIFPRRHTLRSLLYALERLGRKRVFSWMFTYFMINLREGKVDVLKVFVRVWRFFVPRFALYAVLFTVLTSYLVTQVVRLDFYSFFGLLLGSAATAIFWVETWKTWRQRP